MLLDTLFIMSLLLGVSLSQDCKTPGELCNDDKQCCGGCCIQGKCISTYQNCDAVQDDPCLDFYCASGFECYILKPAPDCLGCEFQRECRPFE